MTLEDLGYTTELETYRKENNLEHFGIGRVTLEHKERYAVKTVDNDFDAEIIGNLRFSAQKRSDFPAVGDWVAISEYDENKVLIHAVFPRKTIIERQAVGKQGEKQIIATNIDFAFIVQAVDHDFNLNRLERYLTICNAAKVSPLIILNKIDLIDKNEVEKLVSLTRARVKQTPVIAISNASKSGIETIEQYIKKGQTYCLLGSSGVGKSTLLNNLAGAEVMKTNTISESTNKGRHSTTHRELLVLENGGILIDNPGMREVGIADSAGGLELTFETLLELAKDCRFKDCTHTNETGCAVLNALNNGEIDENVYENYMKMEREKEHFESTVAEKRQKEKQFGKMIKHFKNNRKSNKY
ncbi:ribosome small subunit-dependent GTPase A [uncultured Draconibacterium sp.]|uniref:ribosome small subunit-dependent GTPase A n=1 Tax=uncultured Draconibacterium sp. TaxID=1573823 RepID=UPI003216F1F3